MAKLAYLVDKVHVGLVNALKAGVDEAVSFLSAICVFPVACLDSFLL